MDQFEFLKRHEGYQARREERKEKLAQAQSIKNYIDGLPEHIKDELDEFVENVAASAIEWGASNLEDWDESSFGFHNRFAEYVGGRSALEKRLKNLIVGGLTPEDIEASFSGQDIHVAQKAAALALEYKSAAPNLDGLNYANNQDTELIEDSGPQIEEVSEPVATETFATEEESAAPESTYEHRDEPTLTPGGADRERERMLIEKAEEARERRRKLRLERDRHDDFYDRNR